MRYILRLVPEREQFVPEVLEQIPHLEIVRDQTRNSMDTMLRALLTTGDDPAVHLEDDIELTSDFRAKIEPEIERRPHELVQFFSRRKADREVGSRYEPGRTFLMTQCFYLPAGYAAALYDYYPRWDKRLRYAAIDIIVADWLAMRREKYWIHVPSLVQHRPVKSAIGHAGSNRQSATFVA